MNLRPKYSLRLFLIFATVVTVFLGYSQIRRKMILREADSLADLGGVLTQYENQFDSPKPILPNEWSDLIWQRRSRFAWIYATELANGRFKVGASEFGKNEFLAHLGQLEKKLNRAGAEPTALVDGPPPYEPTWISEFGKVTNMRLCISTYGNKTYGCISTE